MVRANDHMRQASLDSSPIAEIARSLLLDQEVLRLHPLTARDLSADMP